MTVKHPALDQLDAFPQLDLLVVAPHPDDAEISAGGTIISMARQGAKVGVLDLTSGEPTPFGCESLRRAETAAATNYLQLTWRHNLGLANRQLEANLEARRAIAEIFRLIRPKMILAPYWEDAHPDHVAATRLIDDARFWAKLSRSDLRGDPYHPPQIYYYFSIHLRLIERADFIFDVSETLEEKLLAVQCYESQFRGRLENLPFPDR